MREHDGRDGDAAPSDEWHAWATGTTTAPPELGAGVRSWPEPFDAMDFAGAVAAATRARHGPLWLCARFNDLRLLRAAPDDDEGSFLAAAPDAAGRCPVVRFDPRRNTVETRGWPSITAWRDAAAHDAAATDEVAELAARADRTAWLVSALLGVGYATPAEDVAGAATLADLPPAAATTTAGSLLHAVWHHLVAGNHAALDALVAQRLAPEVAADPHVRSSLAWAAAHAAVGRWDAPLGGLDRARVAALRAALAPASREGPPVELAAPAAPRPPSTTPREPTALDALDAWLRDDTRSQRAQLDALATERRAALTALYRADPDAVVRLLRRRLASPKLTAPLAALLAALAAEA